MVFIIFSLFTPQVFDISDFQVLEFWLFSELDILEWFLNWNLKHARINVGTRYTHTQLTIFWV